jgi:hypothetical protein
MMLISRQTTDSSGAQYLKVGESWLRAMEQSGLHTASRNGVIDGFLIQAKKFGDQGKVLVICPTDYAMCCYIGADEQLHFAGIPASGVTLAAMVDVLLGGDGVIDPVTTGGAKASFGTTNISDPVGAFGPIVSSAAVAVPATVRFDHPLVSATTANYWITGYAPTMACTGNRAWVPLSYSTGIPPDPAVGSTYKMGDTWWCFNAFLSGPSPYFMGKLYSRVNASITASELTQRV